MSYDSDCYCDDPRIPVCLWPGSAGHRGSPCQYCDRVREEQDKPWPIPAMCVFCELELDARLSALGECLKAAGALQRAYLAGAHGDWLPGSGGKL